MNSTASSPTDVGHLATLARGIRCQCLAMTTASNSGHLTSSLSAADLMTGLMFGGTFRFNVSDPGHPNNDRLIFSKGHASPLFYALWAAAGGIEERELASYRKAGSRLEGHPTTRFPFAEAATGSLGQGLGIGLGLALNASRLDHLPYRTYVLLGDSEMAEGSQWEAIQLAGYYGTNNLIGVIDVNRLGQTRETMLGRDAEGYARRAAAFGWKTLTIDGHDFSQILSAFQEAAAETSAPVMIVARTIKGKGISFLEDKPGWHGKALEGEDWERAKRELGTGDHELRGDIPLPEDIRPDLPISGEAPPLRYQIGHDVATRKAYGAALQRLTAKFPYLVSLDAEVSNSTMSEVFAQREPGRYLEMFISEQTMVGVALGLSRRWEDSIRFHLRGIFQPGFRSDPHESIFAGQHQVCGFARGSFDR